MLDFLLMENIHVFELSGNHTIMQKVLKYLIYFHSITTNLEVIQT